MIDKLADDVYSSPYGGTFTSYESAQVCVWCGGGFEADDPHLQKTLEHIIPSSLGGPDYRTNWAAAHRCCNQARKSNTGWMIYNWKPDEHRYRPESQLKHLKHHHYLVVAQRWGSGEITDEDLWEVHDSL